MSDFLFCFFVFRSEKRRSRSLTPNLFFFVKKKNSKISKNRGPFPRGRLLLRGARHGPLHDPARRARRGRGAVSEKKRREIRGGEKDRERERERREEKEKKRKSSPRKKKNSKFSLFKSRFSASGHDLDTLLFSFLDELLFAFSTEGFAARELSIVGGMDREKFSLEAVGKGERFDRERHVSGTEVKAITYSAMRILEDKEKKESDIWVIVDI